MVTWSRNSTSPSPIYASYMASRSNGADTSIVLSNASGISLSDNALQNITASSAYCIFLTVVATASGSLTLHSHSSIDLLRNTATQSTSTMNVYLVYGSFSGDSGNANVDVDDMSTIDISSNRMQNSTSATYYNVFLRIKAKYQTSLTISNHSALTVRDNFDR
eukprot:PhF_6_TR27566/c2_g1_i1/m.40420